MKYILLLASVMLISACSQPSSGNTVKKDTAIPQSEQIMMKKDTMKMMTGEKTEWTREEMEAMKSDHMMMSGSDTKMDPLKKEEKIKKEQSKMMKATGYMNYDEMKVSEALASGQKVVLFFHASWCPTCRALDSAINNDL